MNRSRVEGQASVQGHAQERQHCRPPLTLALLLDPRTLCLKLCQAVAEMGEGERLAESGESSFDSG